LHLILRSLWQTLIGGREEAEAAAVQADGPPPAAVRPGVAIAPGDPLLPYFLSHPEALVVQRINLDSPALRAMKEAGVQVAVPLVSQGELVGMLSLGPRLSEQEYTTDDLRLLNSFAAQAAPALRVAQLARQQQAEAAERERIEHELKVARVIQQTLLPKQLPQLEDWSVEALWQPARDVGGDFYDFIDLPDGRLCIIAADVTDKGVPAALVMASARSVLRAAADRLRTPGQILARVNDLLCPDIPPKMFVTCLCLILDPETGKVQYANAGHNLPLIRTAERVGELRATGMPLGLLEGMAYEEGEATLAPGDTVLLYSDGISEAHNPGREMFGFDRITAVLAADQAGGSVIERLLAELTGFTGPEWEQEDDVTLVVIKRTARGMVPVRTLTEFTVPSEPGNERQAMEKVAEAVGSLGLSAEKLERLKTAVAEVTMNAMEHGNRFRADLPVTVRVTVEGARLTVRIADQGGGEPLPEPVEPDLDEKLAGLQSPRGWGLFLIRHMVDEVLTGDGETGHTVDLILTLEGDA
jgi:serine phosphatase RsbU (regulator of sigma subunit)/anti-sigma regulatory factor (Ser/Thr protein kinase)